MLTNTLSINDVNQKCDYDFLRLSIYNKDEVFLNKDLKKIIYFEETKYVNCLNKSL